MHNEIEVRDNRQKEWFWLDNQYLNGYAKHLGSGCTVVYLSLCRHADNNSQKCFPSMKLIAEENGISRDTVMRSIKKLQEWGIIHVEKSKKKDGTQANNVYTLTSKTVWKTKPSSTEQHGKPSSKKRQNRVAPEGYNNTHINNKILFRIKNTKTGAVTNKDFTSEKEAKEFMSLKSSEWSEFLSDLKIVKLSV